jgi:hypothetical protein
VRAPHGGCGVGDRSRTDGREGGDVGDHGGRREEGGECDEGDCPADGVVVVAIEEIAASRGVGEVQIWFLSETKTSEASSFGVWLSVSVHGTGRVANFQFISYRLE